MQSHITCICIEIDNCIQKQIRFMEIWKSEVDGQTKRLHRSKESDSL